MTINLVVNGKKKWCTNHLPLFISVYQYLWMYQIVMMFSYKFVFYLLVILYKEDDLRITFWQGEQWVYC